MTILLERFERCCLDFRDNNAFFIRDQFHTYGSLAEHISGIRELIEGEPSATKNIGVVANDDLETYASVFAIWFAGKTFVPINPGHPAARNADILRRAEVDLVLSSDPDSSEIAWAARILSSEGRRSSSRLRSPAPRKPEDAAYILFTSGSTGIPKGVPIPNRALDGFLRAFEKLGFAFGADDRFLQMFDLTFDLSLMSYCVPLTLGACIYTVPPEGIKYLEVYRLLDEQRITCALMVPSMLARLRPFFSEMRLAPLKASLFCGEALNVALVTDWKSCAPNARILNVYGPTEATIFCSSYECLETPKTGNGIVSIGKPMDGVLMSVCDDRGDQLPTGEKGELCLGGRQLTSGYWRDPERNATAFFSQDGERWYRTGDLCSVDSDGDFIYLGRLDHQVKIQGYRVELSEIEFHVRAITGLGQVAAIVRPSASGENEIHLFLENFRGELQDMLATLSTKVPSYMLPTKTFVLDALPLNANGKIDRRVLQEMNGTS